MKHLDLLKHLLFSFSIIYFIGSLGINILADSREKGVSEVLFFMNIFMFSFILVVVGCIFTLLKEIASLKAYIYTMCENIVKNQSIEELKKSIVLNDGNVTFTHKNARKGFEV